MQKKDNKTRALYESIMREVAQTVKRRLNEADRGVLQKPEQRDKIFQGIFDMIKRRHFEKDALVELTPSLKEPDDLLNAYVSSLLITGTKCPKSLSDVETIGIFKKYLYKYIDFGQFSFGSLKERYDELKERYRAFLDKLGVSARLLSNELPENIFTDASKNAALAEKYKDTFKCSNNRIGMLMTIRNGDEDDGKEFKLWISGNTLNDVFFKYDVVCESSVLDMSESFFEVKTTRTGYAMWKIWKQSLSDKLDEKLEDKIENFYDQVFKPSKNIKELVERMKKFKF